VITLGDDDSAPAGMTVDCSTGAVQCIPLTPDELAAQLAAQQAAEKQAQANAQARAQLISTVQASTDPTIQAMGKLMGVIPSPGTHTPTPARTGS
jgi:hypothetical protein